MMNPPNTPRRFIAGENIDKKPVEPIKTVPRTRSMVKAGILSARLAGTNVFATHVLVSYILGFLTPWQNQFMTLSSLRVVSVPQHLKNIRGLYCVSRAFWKVMNDVATWTVLLRMVYKHVGIRLSFGYAQHVLETERRLGNSCGCTFANELGYMSAIMVLANHLRENALLMGGKALWLYLLQTDRRLLAPSITNQLYSGTTWNSSHADFFVSHTLPFRKLQDMVAFICTFLYATFRTRMWLYFNKTGMIQIKFPPFEIPASYDGLQSWKTNFHARRGFRDVLAQVAAHVNEAWDNDHDSNGHRLSEFNASSLEGDGITSSVDGRRVVSIFCSRFGDAAMERRFRINLFQPMIRRPLEDTYLYATNHDTDSIAILHQMRRFHTAVSLTNHGVYHGGNAPHLQTDFHRIICNGFRFDLPICMVYAGFCFQNQSKT